jgi:hypothetical protein
MCARKITMSVVEPQHLPPSGKVAHATAFGAVCRHGGRRIAEGVYSAMITIIL